jgi:hypothetical protein
MDLSTYMTSYGCSSELMTGQAWLKGGTFAHGAAGPPMFHFSAYSSGSAQVTAVGPTTARFTVPPVSTPKAPVASATAFRYPNTT